MIRFTVEVDPEPGNDEFLAGRVHDQIENALRQLSDEYRFTWDIIQEDVEHG